LERIDGMSGERTDREGGRLACMANESERRPSLRQGGFRAIGTAASRVAAPIIARRGGGVLGRLKAEWAAVVGDEVAAATWPAALGRDGALKLRVASSFALDLQHRAPLVIERINLYFGREAVARLVLVQGPLPLPVPPRPAPPAPLSAAEAKTLDSRLAGIADPELRAALARLGQLVLAAARHGD
jgi:hypothetical protein